MKLKKQKKIVLYSSIMERHSILLMKDIGQKVKPAILIMNIKTARALVVG